MWRGGCRPNISVAAPFVWRCLSGSTIAPFPHTGWAEAVACLRLPQNVACRFPALRSSGVGSQHLVCYSFESCFHGRRFISLHRWPYLPLHGDHVAFEQFNARWPLPHVAGSPDLGVLSASLTAAGPSDRSRLFGLAGPTSVRLSPTALPCSHGTFGQHAGGTNPGSISRRSPWRVVKFCLPPSGIRSATSTTIDFGANCPYRGRDGHYWPPPAQIR